MKNKIVVLALIAAALTAGLVLAGCHENCPENGGCFYNSTMPINERYMDCDDRCINNRLKADSMHIHCDC